MYLQSLPAAPGVQEPRPEELPGNDRSSGRVRLGDAHRLGTRLQAVCIRTDADGRSTVGRQDHCGKMEQVFHE